MPNKNQNVSATEQTRQALQNEVEGTVNNYVAGQVNDTEFAEETTATTAVPFADPQQDTEFASEDSASNVNQAVRANGLSARSVADSGVEKQSDNV